MAEDVITLHQKLTDLINSPDRGPEAKAAEDALFAPSSVYVSYPPQFTAPVSDIPDFRIDNLHEGVSGRTVFAEAVMSGTYRGTKGWLGAKSSGVKFSMRVVTATTFNEAGLITRRALYWDKESIQRQLDGSSPATDSQHNVTFELTDSDKNLLAEFGVVARYAAEYGYY
ncbi:hypothetical protein CK218_12865 [Mesorhizobium sp. WSM3879]|uniref:hypothetical protein n=1 Tax=Mesorhizobium sp. WSM3879 TaxID=2029406 RepID=UPI000BAED3BE|nr:hypothetical protein [Mesorhizobium sp. WSM3879]PBB81250.1 hypothetical protein CK218_12865 [Mesorhizobium sp. WSM3879]